MSQAMLMRIVALEKRVDELEKRLSPPEVIQWSQIHDPGDFGPLTEGLPYRIEQHGASWWRVFGPEGEITEKGLRRHEAQAMADQLNEQTVSRTA